MTEQTLYHWINAAGEFTQRYWFEILIGLAIAAVYCVAEALCWTWDDF